MSKNEMIAFAQKALKEFNQLPPNERMKRLVESGTINEKGEVLMGREATKEPVPKKD